MRVDHDHLSNMEWSWDLYRDEIWAGPCVPPVALRYLNKEPAESSRATKGHCCARVKPACPHREVALVQARCTSCQDPRATIRLAPLALRLSLQRPPYPNFLKLPLRMPAEHPASL